MKQLSEEQIRKIQLNMLQFVHKICVKNNLRYYLCGGSLIGAVRHNGFIPWDDDIDINMPRKDYTLFKELISADKKYKFLTYENDINHILTFGKLIDTDTIVIENNDNQLSEDWGIYIDIFPLDGLPKKNYEKYFKLLLRINRLSVINNKREKNYRAGRLICFRNFSNSIFAKCIGQNRLRRLFIKLSQKYTFDNSEMVCSIGGAYGMREIYPRHYFDKRVLTDFEDRKYYIPAEYDAFLTQMYGDYMKLPPLESRKAHHGLEAYIRDKKERNI